MYNGYTQLESNLIRVFQNEELSNEFSAWDI